MTIIVTDTGFAPDTGDRPFTATDQIPANATAGSLYIDLASDEAPDALVAHFENAAVVRVDFPSFADGRGFTIARRLRELGYTGTLRARGHVLSDQYAMARRCGFDEVEISDDLAARQPQAQWLARADWQSHDYQSRVGHNG